MSDMSMTVHIWWSVSYYNMPRPALPQGLKYHKSPLASRSNLMVKGGVTETH